MDVMWSISEIAKRDGVSKMAVSKAVKDMRENSPDAPVDLDVRGRVVRVSLAHYDHHRQRHVNPAKAQAALRGPARGEAGSRSTGGEQPGRSGDSFEEARRQAEWLKVGREKIRHQEDAGQLIRKDKHEEAVALVGREIQLALKRLPNRADEIAMAVSKEGVHGVRVALRKIAFDIGVEVADRLAALAAAAPEHDAPLDGAENGDSD
ncbi:MAG: hypothetical protein KJ947_11590 [Alphaproteobacteria bacterium]|nr:hypothetical protein [Alphaproteobacteria bacterium]MBU1550199.1 hypothetical protein [Alphaproteobacteria bacterium]MBU2337880.1 hypothetical protein [Alphaproteobacteria bacterium]MBU2387860.1 hypothetical protein [Alphaproteobacteria bacterium]